MSDTTKYTGKELQEIYGTPFLRQLTEIVADICEAYEDKDPEDLSRILIKRLDDLGYCIANNHTIAKMIR